MMDTSAGGGLKPVTLWLQDVCHKGYGSGGEYKYVCARETLTSRNRLDLDVGLVGVYLHFNCNCEPDD